MLDNWINDNYKELKKITQSICKRIDEDLFQMCIEQFIKNPKTIGIPDDQKLYFFTKIVRNNYHSKSSPYYYTYHRFKFNEIDPIQDKHDEPYIESPFTIEWVNEQLQTMDWYYKKLFQLYIEEKCSLTKLSKRTTIPLNSISRDINKVRKELKKRRSKYGL